MRLVAVLWVACGPADLHGLRRRHADLVARRRRVERDGARAEVPEVPFPAEIATVPERLPGAEPFPVEVRERLTAVLRAKPAVYHPRTGHVDDAGVPRYTNRLISESSPYLQQHAHNPVNWYAWGEEAFEVARRTGRPILLSIGYSTCHWCHVMERESFEDDDIARVLNERYVAIKVDREMRPDVDGVYLAAVERMTGRGGWPMTVWLTPDLKPFYGATYLPARDGDRGVDIGFLTLLRDLADRYAEDPARADRLAERTLRPLAQDVDAGAGPPALDRELLAKVARDVEARYDAVHGGVVGTPKFPSDLPVRLLLRLGARNSNDRWLEMATRTLERMAAGGIHDQIGGGFHRYSVDERWEVPHFEKMLYDNARLAIVYLEAWQATGREDFADVVRSTLAYVARDMTSPGGGFHSATDADSLTPSGHQEEGAFFTWTPEDIERVVGSDHASLVTSLYGITAEGNLEGRSVPNRTRDLDQVALARHSAACFCRGSGKIRRLARTDRNRGARMIGEIVGQYRIIEELGAGGMGVVYRAEDTKLGRQVALKFLPETMAADPRALERFRREARAASSLNHPNICTIHDIDDHGGRPFIAMELLEGRTLWQRIQAGPLALDEWLRFALQVADALDAAHAAGMIHRDIKPANLFLTDRGQAKVLDFGLAKQAHGDADGAAPGTAMPTASVGQAPLTREGATIGTIAYMSPEQARGEDLDRRTDVFSLGAVLYEMATGRPAFPGNTSAVVFDAILREAPAPTVHSRPDAPPEMVRIIEKALEKDRRVRYQTTAELAADLRRLRRDSEASQAGLTPASGSTATVAARRTRPGLVFVAGVAGVGAGLAAAAWLRLGGKDGSPPGAADGPDAAVSIAVLPFENFGAGDDQQYLALAVPDAVTSTLSRAAKLAVRPFAMSRRYQGSDADPATAARELGVSHLVTGHFSLEGSDLRVSLETIDAAENRVVWKDGVTVPPGNMIAMRDSLADRVHHGMLPALGIRSSGASGTLPGSEEAYGLYLRSVALDGAGESNRKAIGMLDRALRLDPGYAPAWAELARRHYEMAAYILSDPDQVAAGMERALEATARAIELDPGLVEAVWSHVVLRVERGETTAAFDRARALVERNPRSAKAHFSLSYVYRYAGLLEESIRECETALSLDPRDPTLRSCGIVYFLAGDYDRAQLYFDLDPNSNFAFFNTMQSLMRQGRPEEIRSLIESRESSREVPALMTVACVRGEPREVVDARGARLGVDLRAGRTRGMVRFSRPRAAQPPARGRSRLLRLSVRERRSDVRIRPARSALRARARGRPGLPRGVRGAPRPGRRPLIDLRSQGQVATAAAMPASRDPACPGPALS